MMNLSRAARMAPLLLAIAACRDADTEPVSAPSPLTGAPKPDAVANRPPTVVVTGDSACYPSRTQPCTLAVEARATDPDGDPLSFKWAGCATGTSSRAVCVVSEPGPAVAVVQVSDGRDAVVTAEFPVRGTNRAPVVKMVRDRVPNPAPPHTLFGLIGGQPSDPDIGENQDLLCQTARVTASGACRAWLDACGGVGDVFDVYVQTADPGLCVVEARVADSWGLVGTDRFEFTVR